MLRRVLTLSGALLSLACGQIGELTEVRLDSDDGIPPIDGSTSLDLGVAFLCGDVIADANGTYTITSESLPNGDCQLQMTGDFTVLDEDDYDSIPALDGNTIELLQGIELQVTTFQLTDEGGTALPLTDTLSALIVTAEGTQILDLAQAAALPSTVLIEGAALESIQNDILNQQPAILGVLISATITADALADLPATLGIDFEAQPAIILGVAPLIR